MARVNYALTMRVSYDGEVDWETLGVFASIELAVISWAFEIIEYPEAPFTVEELVVFETSKEYADYKAWRKRKIEEAVHNPLIQADDVTPYAWLEDTGQVPEEEN